MTTEAEAIARARFDAALSRAPFLARGVADSRDRVGWAKARSNSIGASDASGFAKVESSPMYARNKLHNPFNGNGYTNHGNSREPVMLAAYHLEQNFTLFRSAGNPRHVATPDSYSVAATPFAVEAKTTNKQWKTIPPGYRRQVWWAQYVLGVERTLFIWEVHDDYTPVEAEPESVWIDRDDDEIQKLVTIADLVLSYMDEAAQFTAEMSN